jgi:hypothetical protein
VSTAQPARFRPGTTVSDLPPAVQILVRATVSPKNILVGNDPAQIRFMGQFLDKTVERVPRVTDEVVLDRGECLLHVPSRAAIVLSPEMEKKSRIWSANPIEPGSVAIHAIVQHAAWLKNIPEKELTRERVNEVSKALTKEPVQDVRGTLWRAVLYLSGGLREWVKWDEPWQRPYAWIGKPEEIAYRLNSLYKTMIGFAYIFSNDIEAARHFRISPSRQRVLKELSLDVDKVSRTICELSRWRTYNSDPFISALKISCIWA